MFSVFVSHQWVGHKSADPLGVQLAVLRDALQNVLCGKIKVHSCVAVLLMFGKIEQLSTEQIKKLGQGFIWFGS